MRGKPSRMLPPGFVFIAAKDDPSFISAFSKMLSSMLDIHLTKHGGLMREGEFNDPPA